ncbi:MAG: DUF167 domain-containing protein [Acidobacteria bacterium]|nr:DUF167 domain-containing protein [Acidobacteriota bacterium]
MEGPVTLALKVSPGARKTAWCGEMADGTRKVRIAAPPERGRANAELLRFLAAEYGVPVHRVSLVSGSSSTRKTVRIVR